MFFPVLKVILPKIGTDSIPRRQVPSNSFGQREQMLALLTQVYKGQQPSNPHIQDQPTKTSPHSLLIVHRVLHQQFSCLEVLCHNCIPLLLVIHLRSVVDDQITELPRVLALQGLLSVKSVVDESVQLIQGAREGIAWQAYRFDRLMQDVNWYLLD